MRRKSVNSAVPKLISSKGEQALVGPVVKPENRYAQVPALDEGATWMSMGSFWDENYGPNFTRKMRVNTESNSKNLLRAAVRSKKRHYAERTQQARADTPRPYRDGQEINLTVTEDSGWKSHTVSVRRKDLSPQELRARNVGTLVFAPLIAAATVVAIGGNGDRMPEDERVAVGSQMVLTKAREMSPKQQFKTMYINGGARNIVGSFDDSDGTNLLNRGLARWLAEQQETAVSMGSHCLANTGYSPIGPKSRSARFKQQSDDEYVVVTSEGAKLRFMTEDGLLQPRTEGTGAHLAALNCATLGIVAGLNQGGGNGYEGQFVVPYATNATSE